jgi:uncharacterized membrane protein YeaQ/YmgE (transglycosylase-associated protein family)
MGIFEFVFFLVISGLVVGALGRLAVPGPDPMGIGMTILVGVGGSLIGGLIGAAIFGRRGGPSLLLAVGGAALLVWLLRRLRPRVG